jgi:flagellar hook-basal body complex protein FliE
MIGMKTVELPIHVMQAGLARGATAMGPMGTAGTAAAAVATTVGQTGAAAAPDFAALLERAMAEVQGAGAAGATAAAAPPISPESLRAMADAFPRLLDVGPGTALPMPVVEQVASRLIAAYREIMDLSV